MQRTKIAIIYQVVFHYRIPFYERISSDPDFKSILFFGADNPYNKNKSYSSVFKFSNKKLFTIFIPFGRESDGTRRVMPFFPFLFFRLVIYNPEIILCEGASALPNTVTAFIYSKLFRKKLIFWSLGSIAQGKPASRIKKWIDSLKSYLAVNASALFTYSTSGKEYFSGIGVDGEKIFVGVNVVDTNKRLEEINNVKGKITKDRGLFKILFVGSIIEEKRLEILIDSFVKMSKKFGQNVLLTIVGDGPFLDDIKSYALRSGRKNIIFTGKVIEGVSKYFLESDVFVLPGLGGLAISDAMIHGLPVIASSADGTEKDLVTKETGFLLDVMDPDNLYEKLEFLYLNPEIRNKLSRVARTKITTVFSFDSYYEIFKKSVKYAINHKRW